jgi:ATP/ADP translocase
MFGKHITNFFKIHPNDIPNLLTLSLLNMLLVSAHSFGASIVTSLFIKHYGISYLPKMYLISAGAIIICTLLVLKLSRIDRKSLLAASCSIFGMLVIAARILLHYGISVAYPVLYVLADLVAWMFYTQFWALAVELCDVREGKRIFTYVVCAGLIGPR